MRLYLFWAGLSFLSTPSGRRATRKSSILAGLFDSISIHALREEGDTTLRSIITNSGLFLSTPSARRATEGKAVGRFFHPTQCVQPTALPSICTSASWAPA